MVQLWCGMVVVWYGCGVVWLWCGMVVVWYGYGVVDLKKIEKIKKKNVRVNDRSSKDQS